MRHCRAMHHCWNALLLSVLLSSVPWVKGQAESPGSQPAFDEAFEDKASSALESPKLPNSKTYGFRFSVSAENTVMHIVRVPARENKFPDVLLTLDLLLPASNVDIYCRPGRIDLAAAGYYPPQSDYEWKSDHRHGNDYVFISKHHPEYRSYTGLSEDGTLMAYITCTLAEEAGVSAHGIMEIKFSYETHDLVKREQDALDNIFQKCCQGKEHCKKWKEHIKQDNAEATDFCHYLGNYCDEAGHLVQLNLNDQNMSCAFPGEELAKFQRLEKLLLKGNQLKGRLEDVFENALGFKNLQQLEISGASFTGALAEDATDRDALVCEIARQGVLVQLDLVDCGITGPLPHCLLDTESKLRDINLNGNRLSGELPNVAFEESRLLDLVLADNAFTGTIPKSWTAFRNLQALDLSSNQLSGEIPKGFNNSRHLQIMNLANNQLTGSIPEDLSAGGHFKSLNISNNRLTGELPDDFFSTAKNLEMLDLHNNRLSGSIPPSVANATTLTWLDLSHNEFSGSLPLELGTLEVLFTLFLNNNALSGPLPASLGQLRHLHVIYFHSNAFTGTVPIEWSTMTVLRHLRLDDNQLEGEIPAWILDLHNPYYPVYFRLNLTSNKFSSFDEAWYNRPTSPNGIMEFFAARNQIEGEFPPQLAKELYLVRLDLSENKMTGELPSGKDRFRNVHSLNLSSNAFTGDIPKDWAKSSLITSPRPTTMDLSKNKLSGKIPEFLYTTENSDVDRQFFLKGNKFDYQCPLPRNYFYIQDLECDKTEVETDAEAEVSASIDAADIEEKNQESTTSVFSLSDGSPSQNSPSSVSSETSGSSSSNILVPILATIVAICFAVVVMLVAMLIRRRNVSKDPVLAEEDTSSTEWPSKHKSKGEMKDSGRLYVGDNSSVPV